MTKLTDLQISTLISTAFEEGYRHAAFVMGDPHITIPEDVKNEAVLYSIRIMKETEK